jgi:hypothetical protein
MDEALGLNLDDVVSGVPAGISAMADKINNVMGTAAVVIGSVIFGVLFFFSGIILVLGDIAVGANGLTAVIDNPPKSVVVMFWIFSTATSGAQVILFRKYGKQLLQMWRNLWLPKARRVPVNARAAAKILAVMVFIDQICDEAGYILLTTHDRAQAGALDIIGHGLLWYVGNILFIGFFCVSEGMFTVATRGK